MLTALYSGCRYRDRHRRGEGGKRNGERSLCSLGYEVKTSPEGFYYLSIADGQLLLPAAGLRNAYTGNFQHIGTRGYYWGANAISRGTSACIDFNKDDITTNISIFGFRAFGRSVRCVKDNQ